MAKKRIFRYILLGVLLLFVWIVRLSPSMGEWYAREIYPGLAFNLSSLSSLFPFSVGDLFIFLSVAGIIVYPFYGCYKHRSWKRTVLRMAEYLLWVYVWFYLAWGLNYFRKDFYARTGIEQVDYTPESFKTFLTGYITELNNSYVPMDRINKDIVPSAVKEEYGKIYEDFGLIRPRPHTRVKTMLFTPFISKVGVSGYMGPFFCEFNLNGDLLPSQYASTYAHELAHMLGVTSEAEANLYAFIVCTRSDEPQIRFSGYFSLMPHVLRNANGLLEEEEYKQLVASIRPEILRLYEDNRAYWSEKYSPFIGGIQDAVYDWYLKGNNIGSGMKNYSEVIGLLISFESSNFAGK